MKTLEIKLFKFDELTEESKEIAIEQFRDGYYSHNDFCEWAIDDCSLLEPKHVDLDSLLGENYNFPLIKNNRKILFSLGRNRHIDISNGMEVTNNYQFLFWLGIPEKMIENVDFLIGKDTISIEENSWDYEFNDDEIEIIGSAIEKFENYCESILNRIEDYIEYRYSDESIIHDIYFADYEFTKDGLKH